jgi:CBS domain-containing protein
MTKLVKELMVNKFIKVHEDDQIYEVANRVSKDRETLLACVVDKKGKLVGIITPRELLKAVEVCEYGSVSHPFFSGGEALHLLTARYAKDIMSASISVKPDDKVQKAIEIMLDEDFYEVPVVDNVGKLIGEIDFSDIVSTAVWKCDMET